MKKLLIYSLFFLFSTIVFGQEEQRLAQIKIKLEALVVDQPGLDEKVNIGVSQVSIQEFLRAIANAHQLNVNISPELSVKVVNHFPNARVADVFLLLCKDYSLEIDVIGSIISFKSYKKPIEIIPYVAKTPDVKYVAKDSLLSLNLKNDTLAAALKQITDITNINVYASQEVKGIQVDAFVKNAKFEDALNFFAEANKLEVTKGVGPSYQFELKKVITEATSKTPKNTRSRNSSTRSSGNFSSKEIGENSGSINFELTIDSLINLDAIDYSIKEILETVSYKLNKNYFLYDTPEGTANFFIKSASYEEFLGFILNGTDFTYKKSGDVYMIGKRDQENLRTTEVVYLRNRTVEKISEFIPKEISEGVTIKEFFDLNALILSGSSLQIEEIKSFVHSIDQVVPMVFIEVIIVDVINSKSFSTGIQAGFGKPDKVNTRSSGSFYSEGGASPGLQLSSSAINDAINNINSLNLINLGKVVPDFYLNIQAMEDQGVVKLRSTPKLSTLNGHEATASIGQKTFYKLINNNIVSGNVNSNYITQTQQFQEATADLSIEITPFVSSEDQITLTISVSQSDFVGETNIDAPPETVNREFTSTIRVKNEEMVLLGGLEEKRVTNSGSGVPFLGRIPILKWFFSTRKKENRKTKLNIFIRPKVVY